ncbi:uncharacterized protein LOC143882903 [Tasmannia lanceolata]|uniref:uncharacterized protein LOC143882903 n=1 Tax=Tasmannia lanceolata TaxID=3420 RepID=UPI0040629A36
MPQLPHYDGTTDLVDHLKTFKTMMLIHGVSDDFMCRAYPATLIGAARDWYSSLPPGSIRSFEEFGDQLVKHFLSSGRTRKTVASLMTVKQKKGETLKEFIARFNREALQIPNLDPSAAMNALLCGVRSVDFRMSIVKKAPTSLADLITRVEKYITADETLTALNLIPDVDDGNKRKVQEEERGRTSLSGQKAYARQVSSAHLPGKRLKTDRTISFSDVDLEGVILPHNDAMVIEMILSDLLVKKLLVDNGSSANILYYHAFKQMGIPEARLKPFDSHLYGFFGNIVSVEGSVELPMWVGNAPHHNFAMMEFLVVKAQSACNTILGRPGQNLLRAITSAYHQKMKFITPEGIREVKDN